MVSELASLWKQGSEDKNEMSLLVNDKLHPNRKSI